MAARVKCPTCLGRGLVAKSYQQYHADVCFSPDAPVSDEELCIRCDGDGKIEAAEAYDYEDGAAFGGGGERATVAHSAWAAPEARGIGALLGCGAAVVWYLQWAEPSWGGGLVCGFAGAILGLLIAYCYKVIVGGLVVVGAIWWALGGTPAQDDAATRVEGARPQRADDSAGAKGLGEEVADLVALMRANMPDEVLATSEDLLRRVPRENEHYANVTGSRAWAFLKLGRSEESRHWVSETLATATEEQVDWKLWATRRMLDRAMDEGDRSLAGRALSLLSMHAAHLDNAGKADLHRRWALLHLQDGDPQRAVGEFERAVERMPEQAVLHVELAEVGVIAGDYESVIGVASRISKLEEAERWAPLAWLFDCMARRMLDRNCKGCDAAPGRSPDSWRFDQLDAWLSSLDDDPRRDWLRKRVALVRGE